MYSVYHKHSVIEPYGWVKDLFTPNELQDIEIICQSLSTIKAGINDKEQADLNIRNTDISWLRPSNENLFIFEKISYGCKKINDAFYNFDLTVMEDIQFSVYNADNSSFYAAHTDDCYEGIPYRKLSFSFHLSDPDTYSGGNLNLYRYQLKKPIITKNCKNMLVVFPSSTIHEVTAVTKGIRKTLVGWIHGPRFR